MEELKKIGDCFYNAISEVINTMAGFDIHEDLESPDEMESDMDEIMGAMMITGERKAFITLKMGQETAAVIVAYMTGMLPEDLSHDELCDGTAELVNMMAGRAKVCLGGTSYHFHLSSPFSIIGKNLAIVQKAKPGTVVRSFFAGGMPIRLEITYFD